MKWMCQEYHLKEIQREWQTALDQDLISIRCKICPSHFENVPFSICQILQVGNLNNDLKYIREMKASQKGQINLQYALIGLNNTLRGNRKLKWTQ